MLFSVRLRSSNISFNRKQGSGSRFILWWFNRCEMFIVSQKNRFIFAQTVESKTQYWVRLTPYGWGGNFNFNVVDLNQCTWYCITVLVLVTVYCTIVFVISKNYCLLVAILTTNGIRWRHRANDNSNTI